MPQGRERAGVWGSETPWAEVTLRLDSLTAGGLEPQGTVWFHLYREMEALGQHTKDGHQSHLSAWGFPGKRETLQFLSGN